MTRIRIRTSSSDPRHPRKSAAKFPASDRGASGFYVFMGNVVHLLHHPANWKSEQSQYYGRGHERDGGPCKERRRLFKFFRIDTAADKTGYQIADRRSEKPNSHHLADK